MMKFEFERLINDKVSDEDYKKIESVYMSFDFMFPLHEDIAYFYISHGMCGINRMYLESVRIEELKQFQDGYFKMVKQCTCAQNENKLLMGVILNELRKQG